MYIYSRQFHRDAYFVALILMAASLPLSRFAMSVMQFTLLGLWIWAGFSFKTVFDHFQKKGPKGIIWFLMYMGDLTSRNFLQKFRIFLKNKAALVLASLFLLHVAGLLHTSDFAYAMKDLRIKLPLLALPLIICSMPPLETKRFHQVMIFHLLAVMIGTFFSTWELLQSEFTDIRGISVFISPIRFSLNICLAVFTSAYFAFRKHNLNLMTRALLFLSTAWLIYFLYLLESGIGLIIILGTGTLILVYLVIKQKKLVPKLLMILLVIGLPAFVILYTYNTIRDFNQVEKVNFEELDMFTKSGNKYYHDTVYMGIEDGKYCGLYLAPSELKKAWNKRSKLSYEGTDKKGQELRVTLIRFLTSMDLRKDKEGVESLTEDEIKAIERGIANVNYLNNPSLKTRISKIMIGYHNYRYADDPNGSSVLQRIEYWKASLSLIEENLLAGVGTGDLNKVFEEYYNKTNSPLSQKNRWRSHNQYLSIFIAFGVFGFAWFLFTLFYPPIRERKFSDYFYFVFFMTIALSMLTEDTIETQAGVTLFAFFNSFLLFARKKE
ncbi:MAG: O-antigen ligase family protein [Bacteroidales bacterium]|nr:O-antigen ligase family protein [Bacteroidales bacterium]MCF8387978.1 O-antigen ligase family protein [Bacteroidales bacterium]MCF8397386.1 O-antigen ligase family protein [Bacteroidales bacterium]